MRTLGDFVATPPVPKHPAPAARQLNAFSNGTRSRLLEPLYRAAGPEGGAVMRRALARALSDALAVAPTGTTRADARARSRARRQALERFFRCLAVWASRSDQAQNANHIAAGVTGFHPAVQLAVAFSSIWLGAPELDPPGNFFSTNQQTSREDAAPLQSVPTMVPTAAIAVDCRARGVQRGLS